MKFNYCTPSLFLLIVSASLFAPSVSVSQDIRFRIPVTVVDSGIQTSRITLKIGVNTTGSVCRDEATLTGFTDHWTETDSSSSTEVEPPPLGFGWDYRFSYPSRLCDGDHNLLWAEDIHAPLASPQRDTFRVAIHLDDQHGDDIHAIKFFWPSKAVLAQYADSIIAIKSTGAGRFRFELTKADSAIIPYSLSATGTNSVSFFIIIQNPKVPPPIPSITTTAPANGEPSASQTPTFSWNAVPQAVYYKFQLATDAQFTHLVRRDSLPGSATSLTQSTNLSQGTQYFWRILVSNPYGISYYQNPPLSFTTVVTKPDSPALKSPANNATGIPSAGATLQWGKPFSPTPVTYHVQVATTPNFNAGTILADVTGLSDSTYVTPALANCLTYYWHVSAANTDGEGIFSSTRGFRVELATPAAPVLSSPADGATNVPVTPTFSWTGADACSESYQIEVARDAGFSTLVVNQPVSATSFALTTPLDDDTTFYWRVTATNGQFTGPASGVRSFRTQVAPPPVPTLITPTDGQIVGLPAQFVWSSSRKATSYRFEISKNSSFTTLTFVDSTNSDTSITPPGLHDCEGYFWRVRAKNDAGTSNFAAARFFQVAPAAPAAPVLALPADGASVSTSPTLSWSGDSCSYSYHLKVALDPAVTNLVVDQTLSATSMQVGPLDDNVTYYWQVTAANTDFTGPASVTRSFTTQLAAPLTPTLISPSDGQTVGPVVTFVWSSSRNADSYRFEVSKTSSFSVLLFVDSTHSDTVNNSLVLQPCQSYFWRVRAKNAVGTSPFPAARSLHIIRTIPANPPLLDPPHGATGIPESYLLKWGTSDSCLNSYILQVSTDPAFGSFFYRETLAATQRLVGGFTSFTYYYWRVKGLNEIGASAGDTSGFFVSVTPPIAPVLEVPSNGLGGISVNPTMVWDTSARATRYRLQVSYNSSFTLLAVNDTTIVQPSTPQVSRTIGPLPNNTTFYWRVSAKNNAGTSPFSSVFSFVTLSPPPAPTLIQPDNLATNVSVLPTFIWTIADGADTYRLQVASDVDFSVLKYDDSTITTTSRQINTLLNSVTQYWWRVRAKNAAGIGDWSEQRSFTTQRTGVANWEVPVSVCETGPACDTIIFGINQNATFGIDPSLGEYELPQPQPFGLFDTRWLDNDSPSRIGEGLRKNIHPFRNYTQIDTFRISFHPGTGTYPVYISWLTSYVQTLGDSMVIKDEITGTIVHARMDQSSSVTVSNSSIFSLLIVCYGAFPLEVKPVESPQIPKGFTLAQNYPNPFNPSTHVQFSVDRPATVDVTIYDVLGSEVTRLARSTYSAGLYEVQWNGRNERGLQMPSGIYYVRMTAHAIDSQEDGSAPFSVMRKMLMMK